MSKWNFLIKDIQNLLDQGNTNKTNMAKDLIDQHGLTESAEKIRKVVSRLIRNNSMEAISNYRTGTELTREQLIQNGYNPKLKSVWKGPSDGEPGYSFVMEDPEDETDTRIEELKESILKYAPKAHKLERTLGKNKSCAIINLFDAHIDKITVVGKQAGNTIEDNVTLFENTFDKLLSSIVSSCDPEMFIIPVGNDFFNSNVFSSTTVKGTPQRLNTSEQTAFRKGVELYRNCIDKARQYGDVKVVVIKGNHDAHTCFYLGECLSWIYDEDFAVEIDNSLNQRKYVQYGKNLFGFAHGDKEKNKVGNLPLIMAEEEKQAWANTEFREWYMGDIHHKQEFKFTRGQDFVGCMVRFLRSVGGIGDQWHEDQGFVGNRKTAEAFVWSAENGMEANFLLNI